MTDRLPANLLTTGEVIVMLRLDADGASHATALRKLKYLRDKRAFPFHRLGSKTYLYPRAGIVRYLKQTLIKEAA